VVVQPDGDEGPTLLGAEWHPSTAQLLEVLVLPLALSHKPLVLSHKPLALPLVLDEIAMLAHKLPPSLYLPLAVNLRPKSLL